MAGELYKGEKYELYHKLCHIEYNLRRFLLAQVDAFYILNLRTVYSVG